MAKHADHTFAICAYRESPYLEACIRSLKNQTVKGKILIATSTPNSHIQKLAEQYGIPCFVNTGEGGITQDWNFAYMQARTKYITVTHQDDIYEKEYLETALKLLEKADRPLIFFSDYYEIRDGQAVAGNPLLHIKRLMLLPLRIPCFRKSRWVRRRVLSFGSPICCPSVLFAAENLPEVIFQNRFRACGDWEAWEKISKQEGEFLYSAKRLMGHRVHADSETTAAIENHRRSAEEYQMFCKFWPRWIASFLIKFYAKGQKSNQL